MICLKELITLVLIPILENNWSHWKLHLNPIFTSPIHWVGGFLAQLALVSKVNMCYIN
jgi:hypothetical protein